MRTDELIRALAADGARPVVPIERWLTGALLAGIALSAALFLAALHARPDIAAAVYTPAFCFKVVVTLSLAATGAFLLSDAARPTPRIRWRGALLLAPVLLAAGVIFELVTVPAHNWSARLIGHNATHCLSLIPLLAIAPAACLLFALRRGAPARPALAGAMAGLVASAVGATLYALTCPDDSALFVATWYSIAIVAVTAASAYLGSRILRW
ncbi:MAG: NrsF family protein [Gammaproteobacteria bacterium]